MIGQNRIRISLVSFAFAVLCNGLSPAADKPNILFLLSDDHSYPFLSCYGDSNIKTPVLDQLAADGMKFHRFFTAAPQCVPSRAALMTGRSPVAARITRFSSLLARDELTPAALKLPAHWPDLPGLRSQLADYCAEVNRLDRSVKAILDLLASRGFAENTLVVFAGDNGAALPHGKGSLYDPGSNVPFLVLWPGVVKPGGDSRELISAEDLAPTVLAAAGLQPGEKMSGVSFLPLLKGEQHQPRTYLFVERGPHGSVPVTINMTNSGYDLSRAVRSGQLKGDGTGRSIQRHGDAQYRHRTLCGRIRAEEISHQIAGTVLIKIATRWQRRRR